jgi:ketosteroid isomerase-like protein
MSFDGADAIPLSHRLFAMPLDIGARLVQAIAAQDAAALAECFASSVEFRALTPPGFRERTGAVDAASLISQWFGDSTELHLLDSQRNLVGDCLHLAYRFAGVEEGEDYVVEQHLFCVVDDGKIVHADLLCSGFRPPARTSG